MAVRHDHHIHTVLSGHSAPDMVVAAILAQARRVQLGRIVILEHVPEMPRYRRAVIEDRIETVSGSQIKTLREEILPWRARGPLRVLIGAEIDANPHERDGRLLVTDTDGIDVVVASTHFLPAIPALWFEVKDLLPPERLEETYREWMVWLMHVAANPAVDVLAHPGAEMAAIGAIAAFTGRILEDFEKLLRVCARHTTAIELNECLRRKISDVQAESYVSVIALARDLGVRISVGSDAHQLDHIGRYTWVQGVVDRLGLKSEHFFHPQIAEA